MNVKKRAIVVLACALVLPLVRYELVNRGAAHLTRHGDWVMRMRFRGENTRETGGPVRLRLLTRAFHPEARSHHPITAPSAIWVRISAASQSHQFTSICARLNADNI